MPEIELKIMKIPHEGVDIQLPHAATSGSAGLDLCAAIKEPVSIAPGELVRIPTGVAIALPGSDTVGLVYARSGLAVKHGIALSNGVGVIDSDYRGELTVGLCNISRVPYTIAPGERIAQLVVAPVYSVKLTEVPFLDETERGTGGFGSTGKF